MTIDIAPEIAELLTALNRPLDQAVNEMIVRELYREREISVGRAAELLHVPLADFMKYFAASRWWISTKEALAEDIANAMRWAQESR